MIVRVMRIGIVSMRVCDGFVAMVMPMRRARRGRLVVLMLMMRVVLVFMIMLHRLVGMRMLVVLGHVQSHADPHQERCEP